MDTWFSEAIEQYQFFIEKTAALREHIDVLPIEDILQQCGAIKKLQEYIAERDEKLHEVIDFTGPEALENPLMGVYQRALDVAIRETDTMAAKLQLRKVKLLQKKSNARNLKKDSFEYITAINEYNRMIQKII